MLAGFAVGAGVLIAALKDAPTVLADLGPAFSGLQDSISSNFWNQAAQPIRDMTNSLLPQLTSGLGSVASKLGNMFAVAADAMTSELGDSALSEMLANLGQAIDIATGAVRPLVAAFTTLGAVGSDYLAPLAGWFVTLSEKFNTFIQGAAADGRLRGWIDTGIGALKSLGDVIGSVASIFYGLYTAASSAGGAPIQILADGLGKVAAVVNGPAFQGALSTIFSGAAAGMSGLSAALGPIGDMFVKLAPTISNVVTIAGQLAGEILGSLASALSQPAFSEGLTAFFEGIQTGVQAILPHLPTLGSLLGTVATVAGQLAAQLGPVLGAVIAALAPVLQTVLAAVQPLIPILGGALIQIVTALSPLLTVLAGIFSQIAPIISQIVVAVAPLITQLVSFLIPTIQMLMPIVQTVFTVIADVISNAMTIVQGIIEVATGLLTGNWDMVWQGIQNIVSGVWETIVSLIEGAVKIVGSVIDVALNAMSTVFSTIFNGIVTFLTGVWNNITKTVSDGIENAKRFVSEGVENVKNFIRDGFNGAVEFVKTAWENLTKAVSDGIDKAVNFVKDLPDKIKKGIGDLGSTLTNAGGQIIQGFLDGLKKGFEDVKNFVGGIGDWIAKNKGPKAYDLALLIPNGGWIMKGLESGIKRGIPDLNKTLSGVARSVSTGIGDMSANVMVGTQSTIPQEVGRGINRNVSAGSESRGTIVQNINVTIDAKSVQEFNSMTEFFNNIQQTSRTGRGMQNARVA
jgi:phage-related protein